MATKTLGAIVKIIFEGGCQAALKPSLLHLQHLLSATPITPFQTLAPNTTSYLFAQLSH
jgi:hypothetical protein